MYLEFFGLREPPFALTPDPRFVYLSERHREGLAHLLYGVGRGGGGGFVLLTGEVGTGKTTLCRLLLEQLPERTRVALILNPKLSPLELLRAILEELRLELPAERDSSKALVDRLNADLLRAYGEGWCTVVLIDEAQNLSRDALEQLRLLTNLETETQKLLQIILLGQPELREQLAADDLRQLAQRITARYHLDALDEADSAAYVRHRLAVAGLETPPFTRLAMRRLHRHARGTPRLLNVIADRSLLAGYARGRKTIGEDLVDQAAAETLPQGPRRTALAHRLLPITLLLLGLAALALAWWWSRPPPPEPASVATGPDPGATVPALDAAALAARLAAADGEAVWVVLLELWGAEATADRRARARACAEGPAPGLRCLRGEGSLGKLAGFDRPAVLKLVIGGQVHPALLVAIEPDRVRLELGTAEAVWVERTALDPHWFGDFHTLWPHPDGYPTLLTRGSTGPAVAYAAERVHAADGQGRSTSEVFDAALEQRVRRLQAQHGLLADGIIGPETWLALSRYQPGGPRLSAPPAP